MIISQNMNVIMRLVLTRNALCSESSLLVANKDNFLKYEYNNEISSHKEILCAFCFYPAPHTTAIISLLTVKYEIGAAFSFSITMQVYSSISAGTSY